jgi:hypothetical protein
VAAGQGVLQLGKHRAGPLWGEERKEPAG